MGIMYENILFLHTILTNLHHLQAETFLHKTILLVRSKDQRFAMFNVDSILFASLGGINGTVTVIIKDDTILQNLTYRSTFMLVSSLQNSNSLIIVACHTTCKEVTTCTKTELSRAEWVLRCTERTGLRDEASWTGW